MNTNIRVVIKRWGSLFLLLAIVCVFLLMFKPVNAGTSTYFVQPSGSDSQCSQAQPCSLQTAMNLAVDGDEIYVAGGHYFGSGSEVVNIMHSVILAGGWDGAPTGSVYRDPSAFPTTLDGNLSRRVVNIGPNIQPTLDGFRIVNGMSAGDGGGIFSNFSDPIIQNSEIYNNSAAFSGGGVYINNSTGVKLLQNEFHDNTAENFLGGGIYLRNSENAYVRQNIFTENSAGTGGGGIYLDNSNGAYIRASKIQENHSNSFGGGIFIAGSQNVILSHNIIQENTSNNQGGGAYVNNSPDLLAIGNFLEKNISGSSGGGISVFAQSHNISLVGNWINLNAADGDGGGIYIQDSRNATLINTVLTENSLNGIGRNGAGVYMNNVEGVMIHATITRNTGGNGQGVHIQNGAEIEMTNTILVSQTVGIEAGVGSTATLTATLWGDGIWSNIVDTSGGGTITIGALNYYESPIFINPDIADYHLSLGSGAIDRGIDMEVVSDIDNQPRPYFAPDLGADEFWPPGILKNLFLPVMPRK